MEQSDWNEHVQRLTGVNGAILGYMLPDRVKLPEPVDQAELKQKHEQLKSWFIQNVSKDVLVVANGELKHYVDKIGAEIKRRTSK